MSERLLQEHAELMSLVAHDVKNPLSAALANLSFVADVTPAEGDAADAVRDAALAVSRVRQLIDDAVTTAHHAAGSLRLQRAVTRLAPIASAVVGEAQADAEQRRVSLDARCSDDLTVAVHPEYVRRALELLTEVSLRWVKPHGRVLVGAEVRGESDVIFVAHDARSLHDQPQLRAFADAPREARATAIGLSLYYARCVAEAHGASLVAAEVPGWPTELSIAFPRQPGER
jgi:hypothetical protein